MPPILEADRMALALRAALERITILLARAVQAFVRKKAWFPFGHARVADHARERFGRSGRWVCDRAALGRALDSLPGLRDALTGDDGCRPIGTVAALHIGRVASPASLSEWLALARSLPVRELRDAVRRARDARSDRPLETTSHLDAGNAPPAGTAMPAEERDAVRFDLPRALRIAFDETLDLYRAVVGSNATIPSFIEALVAESMAGDHAPEDILSPMQPGPQRASTERALAVETERSTSGRSMRATAGATLRPAALRASASKTTTCNTVRMAAATRHRTAPACAASTISAESTAVLPLAAARPRWDCSGAWGSPVWPPGSAANGA